MESKNKIAVKTDGPISFVISEKKYQLQKVIDEEPQYRIFFKPCTSYTCFIRSSRINGLIEKTMERSFSTPGEIKVRDTIFEILTTFYPQLFNQFNIEKLD